MIEEVIMFNCSVLVFSNLTFSTDRIPPIIGLFLRNKINTNKKLFHNCIIFIYTI